MIYMYCVFLAVSDFTADKNVVAGQCLAVNVCHVCVWPLPSEKSVFTPQEHGPCEHNFTRQATVSHVVYFGSRMAF